MGFKSNPQDGDTCGPIKGMYYKYIEGEARWVLVGEYCQADNSELGITTTPVLHDIDNGYEIIMDADGDGLEDNSGIPMDNYNIGQTNNHSLKPDLSVSNLYIIGTDSNGKLEINDPVNPGDGYAKFRVVVVSGTSELNLFACDVPSDLPWNAQLSGSRVVLDFTRAVGGEWRLDTRLVYQGTPEVGGYWLPA